MHANASDQNDAASDVCCCTDQNNNATSVGFNHYISVNRCMQKSQQLCMHIVSVSLCFQTQ